MAKKYINWKTKGMIRDTSVSAFNPEYSFENLNLRLSTSEGNTAFSWVNEKGTSPLTLKVAVGITFEYSISGTILGTATIDSNLILFTHNTQGGVQADSIYKLWLNPTKSPSDNYDIKGTLLYRGNLKFEIDHPIETLVSYESDSIKKVYWTDGINPLRMININKEKANYNSNSFDFVPELQLNETVTVTRSAGSGEFPSGVIKYAFTYYDKFGRESAIFYTTPQYYISFLDRGAAPDEKVNVSFTINIKNIDTNFEYLRVYSILRTSINSTPYCKRVADIKAHNIKDVYKWYENFEDFYIDSNASASTIIPSLQNRIKWSTDGVTFYPINTGYKLISDLSTITADDIPYSDEPYEDVPGDPRSLFNTTINANTGIGTYKLVLLKIEKTNANKDYIYRINGKDYTWQNNRFDDTDDTTETFYLCIGGSTSTQRGSSVIVADNNNIRNPFPRKVIVKDIITSCTIIDTGNIGETIDPTELLYKGGEDFTVQTLEQKDNTLFLGNIQILRNNIYSIFSSYENHYDIKEPTDKKYVVYPHKVNDDYYNSLISYNLDIDRKSLAPCAGFRKGNYYRFGIQFQHKTGSWSEPIYLDRDYQVKTRVTEAPKSEKYNIKWPIIQCSITNVTKADGTSLFEELYKAGYRRARGVVVLPQGGDRTVLTQGVGCPTICRNKKEPVTEGSITTIKITDKFALGNQSSWFFRPFHYGNLPYYYSDAKTMANSPAEASSTSQFTALPSYWGKLTYVNPSSFHGTEIQINFGDTEAVCIDSKIYSLNSPDVEFDNLFSSYALDAVKCYNVGEERFKKTYSDIDIQTSSPTISSNGLGVDHKSFKLEFDWGIISGLFYDDYLVDDGTEGSPKLGTLDNQYKPVKWEVYAWNQDGSLNNDINRPNGMGTRTAELKKKVISNYRFSETYFHDTETLLSIKGTDLFSSSDLMVSKVNDTLYQGNVDTAFYSNQTLGKYFAFGSASAVGITKVTENRVETTFTDPVIWRMNFRESGSQYGTEKFLSSINAWNVDTSEPRIGVNYSELLKASSIVKMRYKSSPHIVMEFDNFYIPTLTDQGRGAMLPILELRNIIDEGIIFGGKTQDALRANTWIPCGEPVTIDQNTSTLTVECIYGDTYFQRWDCLKTYPFDREDTNQIVEIGSFMVESYVNCDGRYDRNRGQLSNINMSPLNFNLFNPVYSQVDNFFNYKILDDQSHKDKKFPNNITWTKTKQNGADVDLWTNLTLASILELDGDKGDITKILKFNDTLIAFQEKGVSQILYNENTQISTTAGVPIEIANSNKVQGKRYLSGTIGCSNKWSISQTPSGIYFIDDNEKSIYMFNGQFNNVTTKYGFNSWIKQTMENTGSWNPYNFDNFRSFYDSINQEVLFINKDIALAFSEKLDCFTSFYNYENSPFFENIDGVQIWVHSNSLWKHRGGDYCKFFGSNQPYSMTLIANQEPTVDKIFTNLEFRACVDGDGSVINNKFGFYAPFSNVEAWNEYQHGHSELWQYSGHTSSIHGGTTSHMDRMFRIWRIDIPRDNCEVNSSISTAMGERTESELGITRISKHPNNRIRNPWSYIQLFYYNEDEDTVKKVEIHDIMATYFS